MKLLSDIDLSNKKVGIRLDLNVPVKNGEIQSDERLKAALPTIQYVLNETESVTIISHFGRPDEGVYNSELSLKPVCDWFCGLLTETFNLFQILTRFRMGYAWLRILDS